MTAVEAVPAAQNAKTAKIKNRENVNLDVLP
jgi:hypothetical protein